jgi:hypothetical protein
MNDLAVIEAPIVVYETEKDFQKRVRNLHRLQKIVCTMDNGLKSAMRVAQALTVMVQRKLHRLSGGETPQEYVTGTLLFAKSDTGKPFKRSDGGPTTESDLAYIGLGSSVQTNWAREVLVLNRIQTDDSDVPTFTLTATKRRKRAGMRSMPSGELTSWITVEHSRAGICWLQRNDIEKKNPKLKKDKKDENDQFKELIHKKFQAVTNKNVADIAQELGVCERTVWRKWKAVNKENRATADNTSNGSGSYSH